MAFTISSLPASYHSCEQNEEEQCTHVHMTRVYDPKAVCHVCRQPGQFGWVYQCTQDLEDLIEHHAACRTLDLFDDFGRLLATKLKIRKGSPRAKADRPNFLEEITRHKPHTYLPGQIRTIISQRYNVRQVIMREVYEQTQPITWSGDPYFGFCCPPPAQGGRVESGGNKVPWVREDWSMCSYRVCSACRPKASSRAYISLNAVANGESPPTAAAGYGFHHKGERPVSDARTLTLMGLRGVSQPSSSNSTCSSTDDSTTAPFKRSAARRLSAHLWSKLASPVEMSTSDKNDSSLPPETGLPVLPPHGSLKHSPAYDNLAAHMTPPTASPNSASEVKAAEISRKRTQTVNTPRLRRLSRIPLRIGSTTPRAQSSKATNNRKPDLRSASSPIQPEIISDSGVDQMSPPSGPSRPSHSSTIRARKLPPLPPLPPLILPTLPTPSTSTPSPSHGVSQFRKIWPRISLEAIGSVSESFSSASFRVQGDPGVSKKTVAHRAPSLIAQA